MATRSARLAAVHCLQDQATVLYTAPAGEVTLVKTVGGTARAGNVTAFILYVLLPAGTVSIDLFRGPATFGTSMAWQGWVVLEAGDELRAWISGGEADVWVSGTQLKESA